MVYSRRKAADVFPLDAVCANPSLLRIPTNMEKYKKIYAREDEDKGMMAKVLFE
jgi:hypothetical protein